ncbi:LytTR family DNA-binding domain-containing protein [Flavobacteriales bacterium]|nr:LytTR family DNA-binding domain-containing protein [Flavobacteriales bacterium]
MIKTLIIDDEQPAREFLEKLLNRYFPNKFVVVHKVGNIEQGFEQIKLQKPHLVFLDIKMQGGSGFELLKKFDSIDFEVIFTTAYSEFALEAIKQSALDYLLKPINHIELGAAIKKFEKKTKYQNELDRIRILLDNMNTNINPYPKIVFPVSEGYKLIKSNAIIYCKADSNYTVIKQMDESSFTIAKTLKNVEELLPKDFFLRIHKSFLVNVNFIKGYIHAEGSYVILTNNEKLPISSRKKTQVIEKILGK